VADTRRRRLSTISGVGFAAVAVADDTVRLGMLALYAATGGVFSVIQAGLLARVPTGCRIRRLRAGLNRWSTWAGYRRRLRVRQLPHRSDGLGCPTELSHSIN
jgi:hypothetical protein